MASAMQSRVVAAMCPAAAPRSSAQPIVVRARTAFGLRAAPRANSRSGRLVVRAEAEEFDFDSALAKVADKFEKAENKPAIIGYSVATVIAIWFSEYLIHLPLFNVLLGFPIQLIGLLLLPYFGIRYVVDQEDVGKDIEYVVGKITGELPGLGK